MKKMFHFLGSYYFAIILIFFLAIIVALGTFLESIFDSHLYAADLTYSSPAFSFLLVCVFINVLFSALRRWPFKLKHIPFLITHLGLLMIISGTIIKIFYGVQGTMTLVEGMGSDQILLPQTHVIRVEKKDSDEKSRFQNYELIGRKNFKPLQENSDLKIERICAVCGNPKPKGKGDRCKNCYSLSQQRSKRPELESLQKDIKELGFEGTGRKYSVTGNSIRKWVKALS